MNGAHDMGGSHGFGAVIREPDEPVFHERWERRAFALTLAMGATGEWSLDASRFAREDRSPADYLSRSYYQLWLAGLERLLADSGLVAAGEIASGRATLPGRPVRRTLAAADVAAVLARGAPTGRPAARAALFARGDRVRARTMHPTTHTRLPRYVRGRAGTVVRVHGCHVFPDSNAHGLGEDPQWLYTVSFHGPEIWGTGTDASLTVMVDAFEPYLESMG